MRAGNQGNDPILQRGPYELTFLNKGREVDKQKVDPTDSTNIRITVTEPDRIRALLVAQVTGSVRWRESVL